MLGGNHFRDEGDALYFRDEASGYHLNLFLQRQSELEVATLDVRVRDVAPLLEKLFELVRAFPGGRLIARMLDWSSFLQKLLLLNYCDQVLIGDQLQIYMHSALRSSRLEFARRPSHSLFRKVQHF